MLLRLPLRLPHRAARDVRPETGASDTAGNATGGTVPIGALITEGARTGASLMSYTDSTQSSGSAASRQNSPEAGRIAARSTSATQPRASAGTRADRRSITGGPAARTNRR